MKKTKHARYVILLLVLGFVFRIVLSFQTYSGDVNNHVSWGRDILDNGTPGIYQREFMSRYGTLTPTYPPIPLLLFTASHALYDWVYDSSWQLNTSFKAFPSKLIFFLEDQDSLPAFLKLPAIVADIGLTYLVYLFAKKMLKTKSEKYPLVVAALVLFNPAFFYNSAYWGQIEAIPLVFLVAAFYLIFYSKNHLWAAAMFACALLTKQTAIIFTPIFLLAYWDKYGLAKLFQGLVGIGVLFYVFFLPFYQTGSFVAFPFATYWNKIQTGSGSDFVVDHAFNFWSLVVGLGKISDTTIFVVASYKVWGYLLFLGMTLFVCAKAWKKRTRGNLLPACYLIAFAAFLFLTKMHERYLTPALPFLLVASIKNRHYLAGFVFLSMFNFFNLYHNWWAPKIPWLVAVLQNPVFVVLLTLSALGLYFWHYIDYTFKRG